MFHLDWNKPVHILGDFNLETLTSFDIQNATKAPSSGPITRKEREIYDFIQSHDYTH